MLSNKLKIIRKKLLKKTLFVCEEESSAAICEHFRKVFKEIYHKPPSQMRKPENVI